MDTRTMSDADREAAHGWDLDGDCGCDPDEMLPCEQHMTVVAQREGASQRTADELASVFIHDAVGAGVVLSPWGRRFHAEYDEALEGSRLWGVSWLPENSEGLADDMTTLISQVETDLFTMDDPIYVHWDDGYVMFRLTADCPLREE